MNRQEAIEILSGLYRVPVENGADEFAQEINKAIDIAIKSLQGDMYCPSCGVRLVSENEYVEPKPYKESDGE